MSFEALGNQEEYIDDRTSRFIDDHPQVRATLEGFCESIGEIVPSDCVDAVAAYAVHHFVEVFFLGSDSLLGATEAALRLGLTHQRLSQIAREDCHPKPIAWIGGKRPVWLASEVTRPDSKS